jgi:hypothetical protein
VSLCLVCAVEHQEPAVLCNVPFSYCRIDADKTEWHIGPTMPKAPVNVWPEMLITQVFKTLTSGVAQMILVWAIMTS